MEPTMQPRAYVLLIALAALPQTIAAQGTARPMAPASSTSPVADALRAMQQRFSRILIAAAEAMPAGKYNYPPTPPHMTFPHIQPHPPTHRTHLPPTTISAV